MKRKEETRERKAEAAAKVERAIERELIERLRTGAYGDRPLNVEESIWKRVLKGMEKVGEGTRDVDYDEGIEVEEEYERERETELEGEEQVEYVSWYEEGEEEEEEEEDLGDLEEWLGGESGDERSSGGVSDAVSEEASEEESEGDEDKAAKGGKAGSKRKRLEIEYEQEAVVPEREVLYA